MSNSNEFERKIARLKKEVEREVYDRLPRKVGVVAVRHFKQNFREGGFVEGGGEGREKGRADRMARVQTQAILR